MKVVPPISVTDAIMNSNVPALDFEVYSATKEYKVGDSVTLNNVNWEALIANTGKNPETDKSVPSVWLNKGPTNRWRMFNKKIGNTWSLGTYTSNPDSVYVAIRPGARVNSFGLVGVRAASVRVVMTVPGVTDPVYDRSFPMTSKNSGSSWYRYYFQPFTIRDNLAQFDLPAFANADIQVLVSAPGGTARVGMLVLGMAQDVGVAVYGTGIGSESYSSVKEDDFGNVTIVPRGRRRTVDFDIVLEGGRVSSALRVLESLSDTAALYIGSEEVDSTIIVGRFETLDMVHSTYDRAEYSLSVRSLM